MQQSCEKIRLNAQWLQKEAQNVLQYLKENPPSAKPSGGDRQSNCFCLKVMFLAKGVISLSTCLCLFLLKDLFRIRGQSEYLLVCFCLKVMFLAKGTVSLFTCLFLFKGDVSSKGDSQSVYLSVSVSL